MLLSMSAFVYCLPHQVLYTFSTIITIFETNSLPYLSCCACTGSLIDVKTEADSNDVTEHPHDDKPRPHVCTVCNKRFTTKSNLNVHKRRHTDTNIYTCSHCGKCFTSQQYLRSHMNTHTSKYKCTECGKCFQDNKRLTEHSRIHSGEKPFECTVCSKQFTRAGSLVTHSRTHSGEKPYNCHLCDKAFNVSANLHTHTSESTQEKNSTNATCVTRHLVPLDI